MTDTTQFYLSQAKTPLPSAEELCSKELGASFAVDFIPNRCSCQIPLGHHTFELGKQIAIARVKFEREWDENASENEDENELEEKNDRFERITKRVSTYFFEEQRFKECCRGKMLATQVEMVVSADIGALFVSQALEGTMLARTKNAPGVTIMRPAAGLPVL